MKIGIISQSPLWTTGFSATCNQIALGLIGAGHTVYCFSVGKDKSPDRVPPFNIFQYDWPQVVDGLSVFFSDIHPDVLLINFDIYAVAYLIMCCRQAKWTGRLFAHVVIDGFPVSESLLNIVKELNGVIVPTKTSQFYLQSEGLKNVFYAPHGVDHEIFRPIKNKAELRLKLNARPVLNKSFLIGVFAKNEERKQIPKILMALHHLVFKLKQEDILIYLHTQVKPNQNKGWDLKCIVSQLNLTEYVIFTEPNFEQHKGIELKIDNLNENKREALTYVERLNMCDLIINIPFSGGFELCNIEAQSCGIPLLTINDKGNIKEVVGESSALIEPIMKNIWSNGACIYFVDEVELANKILILKNDEAKLDSLKKKGVENAAKFSWDELKRTVNNVLRDV